MREQFCRQRFQLLIWCAAENTVFFSSLVHFMEYEVSVQACNHAYREVGCSKPQVAVRRTKKREGADDINSTVTVEQMTKLVSFVFDLIRLF